MDPHINKELQVCENRVPPACNSQNLRFFKYFLRPNLDNLKNPVYLGVVCYCFHPLHGMKRVICHVKIVKQCQQRYDRLFDG